MSGLAADPFVQRIERDTLVALAVLAGAAFLLRPSTPAVPLGVLGGGALIAVSYWGLRGGVDALTGAGGHHSDAPAETRRARLSRFVKFFTRHAILALAAYAMIARLHLDPVGMLAGVSSPGIAAAAEFIRATRAARHAGRGSGDSRSS